MIPETSLFTFIIQHYAVVERILTCYLFVIYCSHLLFTYSLFLIAFKLVRIDHLRITCLCCYKKPFLSEQTKWKKSVQKRFWFIKSSMWYSIFFNGHICLLSFTCSTLIFEPGRRHRAIWERRRYHESTERNVFIFQLWSIFYTYNQLKDFSLMLEPFVINWLCVHIV